MAGKSRYTEADKARVYVALTVNDGNIKRTARDTGVAETTVRRWKGEFEKNPPAQEVVEEAVGDFVETIERVEWKALKKLEEKIEASEGSVRDLATVFGILNDKRTRVQGLADQTVVHEHRLPSAEEVKELLQGLTQGAIEASRQRQSDVLEMGLREQPALPRGTQ